MPWRPLHPTDLPALTTIANQIHQSLPERPEIFAERIRLFPQGCWALEAGDDGQLVGYAISHPIRAGQPPALDTLLGRIAPDADQYYIHDVAVLPRVRGRGLAAEGVRRLLEVAGRYRYQTTGLVSVYGTEGFWGRFGFRVVEVGEELRGKVAGYGGEAVFLVRRNGGVEGFV
ncbi:GNAT family N-acetyltransferase [Aspergillus fijiensis CBS 313.89]|uniref:Acyl-CoA N-acyltransferase n=1 Tax=Aspergillus fijiensis CBS 313.89 TaxID=1448319 RepID=A0A8G1S1H2_9EURO|nr:acyl-CoA N-acyltransferase [Aspergillus fijiensis CBS 313.89]RAK82799.1 acyl-CoA N-acyltransferase [Aspergillus fijiensis CBS 313.89]